MLSQRDQYVATPLSVAFGNNTGMNFNQPPPPPFQGDYYNNTNYVQASPHPLIGNPTALQNFLDPLHNPLNAALIPNFSAMPSIPLMAPSQGLVFYGDLEVQTCNNVKGFTKEPAQNHICLLLLNILVYVAVIAAAVLVLRFNVIIWTTAQIVGVPYFLYFFFSCCRNPFAIYFSNMKNYNQIDKIYSELQQKTGHIKLKADCYHFTKGKHKRKIISHTAIQTIPVRQCIDTSEQLIQMKENYRYLYCKIKKYFYFADQNSHSIFLNTFNMFKNSNHRDTHQTFYHSLDITVPGFVEEFGLSTDGGGTCLRPMYIIFLLLGLGYPYIKAIECTSQRYSINLTKRLTL